MPVPNVSVSDASSVPDVIASEAGVVGCLVPSSTDVYVPVQAVAVPLPSGSMYWVAVPPAFTCTPSSSAKIGTSSIVCQESVSADVRAVGEPLTIFSKWADGEASRLWLPTPFGRNARILYFGSSSGVWSIAATMHD